MDRFKTLPWLGIKNVLNFKIWFLNGCVWKAAVLPAFPCSKCPDGHFDSLARVFHTFLFHKEFCFSSYFRIFSFQMCIHISIHWYLFPTYKDNHCVYTELRPVFAAVTMNCTYRQWFGCKVKPFMRTYSLWFKLQNLQSVCWSN